ncbi:MAG: ethanolamine utilization protein EutH [Christensenellaceae bacterium]|nr:ethanolamine utilization protein EutH [Christensenellaceae bacterium]
MMNQALMIAMAAGAVLGGMDRMFGNRLGLGEQFEKGFHLLGSMALSMVGMICLAPVLANALGRVIVPLYQAVGVDPAMFGSFLAIDMGGYQLAKELAANPQIGSYAGLIVSAVFGCTLVFTIPVGMGMIESSDRDSFARGVMLGLAAMPVGLIAGGLACGLSLPVCLWQNVPVFLLSLLLLVGLWRIPHRMVRGFCAAAEGIKWVITVGLMLAAVESLTGWNPVPGMAPIEEAMGVVASIGVVMLGSLPMAELLRRALERPFHWLGGRLGLNTQSITGMLVSLVTALPALSMYHQMDRRGKVTVGAFLVSGTSLLAAHLGFVISTEPELLGALMAAKLSGALAAAALAIWVQRRGRAAAD